MANPGDALLDLWALVRLLQATVSQIITKLDDPEIAAFWFSEWEKIIAEGEARIGR